MNKTVEHHKPISRPPVPTAVREEGASVDDMLGKAQTTHITSSEDSAYYLLKQISKDRGFGEYVDYPSMIASLKTMAENVNKGDMREMEAMLVSSAKCLEVLAESLLVRGLRQDQWHHLDGFLKLGLKAQNQMRHTIETLGKLKNPPVVIAKQANLATNQQVNNGISHDVKAITPNKQSEGNTNVVCQNQSTPTDAIGNDSSVETVAKVHRCKDQGG